ncbi:glycosyltransferase family 39 protein [Clostridium scatologenes]|uniref:Glycosyltransferase RgtA/B/C/D-like domain-containing protein n=1 Tax=Clostridium scatologenes TaxID=1548 RepID=A0A0E3GR86_CLOSL|nr:glycosyltransferase family 39 protein [Clostridium scatologenes]AKA69886.1 hypothetical protein CSCA_2761 [Clostridium scatologenes]
MKIKSLKESMYYKVVIVLGLLASILWVTFVNTQPFSDFDYYYNLSVDIANGFPWGDTYTSVGYCIVLGGIFKLFGASILKAKIFNILLIFVSNICFISILDKLDIKERKKKIIFVLFVFMPNNIFYNSILATEVLFTTILLLITNIYFGNAKFKYLWIGILTGLNTMVKPFFIIFFFAIFLVDLLKEKKFMKSMKNSFLVLLVSTLVISPWIYRNTKLVGQFTYVSNNGGIVLYINNNSQNNVGRWMAAEEVENSIVKTDEYKSANMTQKNKMLSNAAKNWIKDHPVQFVELGIKRLFNTYFVGDDILYSTYGSGISDHTKTTMLDITNNIRNLVFGFGIIYILIYSICILKSIFKKQTELLSKFNLYLVVLFFMFTSVYFVTEGQGRYAFPEIFIMIYSFCSFIDALINVYKELRV